MATRSKKLSHVDARGRVKMVDVGDKPITNREAVARGTITMSRGAAVDPDRRCQERRPAADRAAGRQPRRQTDLVADSALPSAAALERERRADPASARLRYRSARAHHVADRRGNGGAYRRRRRRAHHLRHGEGGRQDDGDRRHSRDVQVRRPLRHVSTNMNVVVGVISPAPAWIMPRSYVDQLRRDFPQHTFLDAWDRDTLRRFLPEAEIAFTPFVDRDIFASATRLRWVQSPAVGVGSLMFTELLASQVVLTSARGIRARSIAEHVLGLTIALARQLPAVLR